MIQWVQLPLYIMQLNITTTACAVYALIANRYRLSVATHARSGQWSDRHGVYCVYPRAELAAAAGVSINTITRAMAELVGAGLITDRRMGRGMPNRIYVIDGHTDAPIVTPAMQMTLEPDPAPELAPDPAELLDPAPDPAELLDPAPDPAELLDPAPDPAELLDPAPDPAELPDPAPDPAELPEAELPAATAAGSRIPNVVNLESQHLGHHNKKKKKNKNNYSDNQSTTAIMYCLKTAYNIDPADITDDQIDTARTRCARARSVIRNPIAYIAAIISNMVTAAAPIIDHSAAMAAEWEEDYILDVLRYSQKQEKMGELDKMIILGNRCT